MFERLISTQIARAPDAAAIILPNQTWSYSTLGYLTYHFAAKLSREIQPGQRVLIDTPHLGIHWLATLAVEMLGGVSMALPGVPTNAAVLAFSGADVVIVERPLDFQADKPVILIDEDWIVAARADETQVPARQRTPGDEARIVVTSGTTGVNRKIMLTRGMLDLRISHAVLNQVFAKEKPRVIAEIGPGSIGGLMMGLAAWAVGGAICQRDPKQNWAEALDEMKIDALVLAPIQLQMMLATLPEGYRAPEGMALFVAGGSLSKPLMEATRAKLTDNIVLTYGATETGSVALGHAGLLEGYEDGAGFVQPWAEVEVIDEHGVALPPDTLGEIRIRGDEVVEGYYDDVHDPERASFKDGWFYPRDLGFVSSGGVLKVLGRLDDLLHLGGDKVLPSRLEEWALSVPGVADAAAFSLPNDMGLQSAWLAYVKKGDVDAAALQARLENNLRRPVRLIEVPVIPRNALGKIVRPQLREIGAKALAD